MINKLIKEVEKEIEEIFKQYVGTWHTSTIKKLTALFDSKIRTIVKDVLKSVELEEKPEEVYSRYGGVRRSGYNQAVKQQKENHKEVE